MCLLYMINPAAWRKVWVSKYSSIKNLFFYKFVYYNTKIIDKMGEHLKIIEYPENDQVYRTFWG